MPTARGPSIILFDGICSLCDASVNFIIDRDLADRFRFGAIQSAAGRELLARHGLEPGRINTVVLIEEGRVYVRSTAAIRIMMGLGGWWRLAAVMFAIPVEIRDWVYDGVARNRYRVFGRREECRLMTPKLRGRFL